MYGSINILALLAIQEWAAKTDDRFSSQLNLSATRVQLNGKFVGSQSELENLIQQSGLYQAAPTKTRTFMEVSNSLATVKLYNSMDDNDTEQLNNSTQCCSSAVEGFFSKKKSEFAYQPILDEGLCVIQSFLERDSNAILQFEPYGGVLALGSATSTPFPHRKALMCLQYWTTWNDNTETPKKEQFMREWAAALEPYVSGAHYRNYEDLDVHDWPLAYYGEENFMRLKKIKRQVDPTNMFRNAQSIPLE
jgi:FAD/FMN-containing dehydrogenase